MTERSIWFSALAWCSLVVTTQACATLSATEAPPCDEATLAAITATCTSEEDCNAKIDERQATCSKRIQEEK